MGAITSINKDMCNNYKSYLHNCEYVNTIQIHHFGHVQIYKNPITNQQFFMHSYEVMFERSPKITPFINNKNDQQSTLQKLTILNNQCDNLVQIWKIQQNQDQKEKGKVYVYFEYLPTTLKQLIDKRTVPFPQNEVIKIFGSLLTAVRHLNENESYHGDIAPEFIYFDDSSSKNKYKIFDSIYFNPIKNGYHRAQTQKVPCAPEILSNLHDNRVYPLYNHYVCDSFSIGLVILYCTTLIDPLIAYRYKEKQIDYYYLENLIRMTLKNRYSQKLIKCIRDCLQHKNRATVSQILQKNQFLRIQEIQEEFKYSLKRVGSNRELNRQPNHYN